MEPVGKDVIRVKDRLLNVSLASGARWPAKSDKGTLQPISISIDIFHDVAPASATDDLTRSINYSNISKELGSVLEEPPHATYQSLEHITNRALSAIQGTLTDTTVTEVKIKVTQLKAPLHCGDVGLEAWSIRENGRWNVSKTRHFVTDFTCPTIVGVNDVEREEAQDVVVNISVETPSAPVDRIKLDFRRLMRSLWTGIGKSSYLTLESLTSYVAQTTLSSLSQDFPSGVKPSVTVAVAKPCALVYSSASEVQVTRTWDDFPLAEPSRLHKAAIALGSNLGDRFYNIEYALRLLENPGRFQSETELGSSPEVTVVDTSFLYETAPMYVTDQPAFINGACLVETNLEPTTLLQLLKAIESTVGRVPSIRYGPRAVDLDLIFYDNSVLDTRAPSQQTTLDNLTGEIVIPHPRLQEREFVLRPLNDMIPDYVHPVLGRPIRTLLGNVRHDENDPPMRRVLPFPNLPHVPLPDSIEPPATLTYWLHPAISSTPPPDTKTKTRLMATLNVTPDSFSDGSDHNLLNNAISYIEQSVSYGADIVDIGGYSTRPGAAFVSVDEEILRVAPVVQAIRSKSDENICHIPISVDTFRWEVAQAAVEVGANIINDVYAFTGPKSHPGSWQEDEEALQIMVKMKELARRYSTPVVLMHSRGDAGQHKDYLTYAYAKGLDTSAVVEGVRSELGEKVERIIKGKGGVRRWLVIADPGIGFSKTVEDNLELLRHGAQVVEDVKIRQGENGCRNPLAGFPTLVGTSRKSFLGTILSQGPRGRATTPKERVWATGATVACAIQQGAMIVRVHDIKEMADVVVVADALWA
ncbi:Dihydropteroate synthase [Macrolepiota fuliginosa MF-IS2]|uniref:Dihydropteroate synthase n=1 Tax=Macrolepiota fuliginosa MF-IS2 TaxID=1400762 RepID=A0A9P5XLS3_9AGAR|nr:Dihydropteroate synthase [Macrolepiota fuliginosa MF-IS2]